VTVRHAPRSPVFGAFPAHIDNRKVRIDFAGTARDIPALHPATPEIDVRHQGPVSAIRRIEQLDGLLSRGGEDGFKTAIPQRLFRDPLQQRVVVHDQNDWQVFQCCPRCLTGIAPEQGFRSGEMYKSERKLRPLRTGLPPRSAFSTRVTD
jgi:hypothetical protein